MPTQTNSSLSKTIVLARLVLALGKGTGARLSAEDVQVLRPMLLEAARRQTEVVTLLLVKGRATLH